MGLHRLKRLLVEDLTRSFTTSELQHLLDRINRDNLSLYNLTGYPANSIIPGREASKQIVDYCHKSGRFTRLLDIFIHVAQHGFRGESVHFNNIKQIVKEMAGCGYIYRKDLKKVVKVEANSIRNDWGFLEENKVYNFCFVSIDICGNSRMVRKYNIDDIRTTYLNFKNMVNKIAQSHNGRIWSWEGDGGLLAFHIKDIVNDALFASIEILSAMVVFNSTQNMLNEPIKIRIGINGGAARYKKETATVTSDAVEKARDIEKHHTRVMTISISKHTFQHVHVILRKYFQEAVDDGETVYRLLLPVRS